MEAFDSQGRPTLRVGARPGLTYLDSRWGRKLNGGGGGGTGIPFEASSVYDLCGTAMAVLQVGALPNAAQKLVEPGFMRCLEIRMYSRLPG